MFGGVFIKKSSTAKLSNYSLDLESGSSQSASITDGSQTGLDITGALSIECWVNFESLPSGAIRAFVAKYNATGDQQAYIFGYREDGGPAGLYVRLSSDGADSGAKSGLWSWSPSLSTWYHVAMTFDPTQGTASDRVITYIDGSSQGAGTTSWNNSIFNSSGAFRIGATDNGLYHDGLIDEVRVFDDVRTGTEINNNKAAVIDSGTANLQGYWRLENDYTDETSNSNDLTANNSPVFSTDTPF